MHEPKIGDDVRIIDGPFFGYVGRIVDVRNAERKVRVVTQFSGRSTPVELEFEQVEVLAEPA